MRAGGARPGKEVGLKKGDGTRGELWTPKELEKGQVEGKSEGGEGGDGGGGRGGGRGLGPERAPQRVTGLPWSSHTFSRRLEKTLSSPRGEAHCPNGEGEERQQKPGTPAEK